MANEKDEFNLKNLPPEANDPEISKDDFKLVQVDAKIHDQKFQTKPTTFLKDCFRRFCKNKSSVVAAIILGILLVMSVVVPLFGKTSEVHETRGSHPDLDYLEPRLFPSGTGFWDGTKKLTNIPVNTSDEDPANWGPDKEDYPPNAISDYVPGKEQYTDNATPFGKGGYVQFGYYSNLPLPSVDDNGIEKYGYVTMAPHAEIDSYDFEDSLIIENFDVFDKAKLQASSEEIKNFPEGYSEGKTALYFIFEKGSVGYELELTEYKTAHDIGNTETKINVKDVFNELYDEKAVELGWTDKTVKNPVLQIRLKNENTSSSKKNTCALISSIKITAYGNADIKKAFEALSFESGNQCIIRKTTDLGMWEAKEDIRYCRTDIYLARAILCSFTFDTYEAALGTDTVDIPFSTIEKWMDPNTGYIKFSSGLIHTEDGWLPLGKFVCEILDDDCPLAESFSFEDLVYNPETGHIEKVKAKVLKYKLPPYELSKMPIFLMGTDQSGRDMFIYVFEGLRTSLLLGIATTVVCFLFGLLWGSISGYFGGTVDLIMERFTDILAGVPWIVVMTLVIIKAGNSSFGVFALALCLTGWIGTAATTRTQFYRFRGREYVLASRTLGASHGRLIAKHILPNAMGTIITSAVLMVPSVIFSEATLSYLGLAKLGDGDSGLSSLGVILSDNQSELTNHPYLLIFPSVIIALLMISFNLFGNGLRDAVNPSLKGEGE